MIGTRSQKPHASITQTHAIVSYRYNIIRRRPGKCVALQRQKPGKKAEKFIDLFLLFQFLFTHLVYSKFPVLPGFLINGLTCILHFSRSFADSADKSREQWVSPGRSREKFRVELRADHEGMVNNLCNFH